MSPLLIPAIGGFFYKELKIDTLVKGIIAILIFSFVPMLLAYFAPLFGIEVTPLPLAEAIRVALGQGIFGFILGVVSRYVVDWAILRVK